MFLYGNWLKLSIVTRMKLADKFGIKKTGTVHVFDNQVQSDGYSVKDVEKALNLKDIQSYLETEESDLVVLWSQLVDKIEGKTPFDKFEEQVIKQAMTAPVVEEVKESKTILPKLTPSQLEQVERSANIAPNTDKPKKKTAKSNK